MAEKYSIDSDPCLWRPIGGYEGIYEVSSKGEVRSLDRVIPQLNWAGTLVRRNYPGRTIKPVADNHGYLRVSLARQGQKAETKRVHHLVAAAFLGPRPDGHDICHNDGDQKNNAASNLRYATRTENEQDKRTHGSLRYGETHMDAKLNDEVVRSLRVSLQGKTQRWWAKRLGVSDGALSHALSGVTWRHLNSPATPDRRQFDAEAGSPPHPV